MTDLVCIKKFGSRYEANIAKSVLDASHIVSFIQSDDAGGMYPFMTEQIRLLVKKTDIQTAKKILQ
jgi:hypothetical protein